MKIVLATIGTLGDVYPYIAVAHELQMRGHRVVLSTAAEYRDIVEAAGLQFAPIPPSTLALHSDKEVQRKALHPVFGTEYVIRKMVLPSLSAMYYSLFELCGDADLLVGHFLAYAVPLVAERRNIKWIQVFLHPTGLMSGYDPPAVFPFPAVNRLLRWSPACARTVMRGVRAITSRWATPIEDFRRQIGLGKSLTNPISSPASQYGNMGWFPRILAPRQPDWPSKFEGVGYPFLDSQTIAGTSLSEEMEQFLVEKRPIVFTLGSAASAAGQNFYQQSLLAAQLIDRPALLIGPTTESLNIPDSSKVKVASFLPFDRVYPHASVVVHHGGMGSMAQCLRYAKPAVIVPFAWDQPDNATRAERLGLAEVIRVSKYKSQTVARCLKYVLNMAETQDGITARDAAMPQKHDGVVAAIKYVEGVLADTVPAM